MSKIRISQKGPMRRFGAVAWPSVRRRRLATTLLAASVAVALVGPTHGAMARPSTASAPVLRSGTIVGGILTTAPSQPCQGVPDCAAWLASGCPAAAAGHDPAWITSIVDVRDLTKARSSRLFRWGRDAPYGVMGGGVVVQFWTKRCIEIHRSRWLSWQHWPHDTSHRFRMPRWAKWMTVTAPENVNVVWTLR